jgi:hypothetical protein
MAIVLTSEQRAAAEAIARKRFGPEAVPVWDDPTQPLGLGRPASQTTGQTAPHQAHLRKRWWPFRVLRNAWQSALSAGHTTS